MVCRLSGQALGKGANVWSFVTNPFIKKYDLFCVWIPKDKRPFQKLKFYQEDLSDGKQMLTSSKQILVINPFCSVSTQQAPILRDFCMLMDCVLWLSNVSIWINISLSGGLQNVYSIHNPLVNQGILSNFSNNSS